VIVRLRRDAPARLGLPGHLGAVALPLLEAAQDLAGAVDVAVLARIDRVGLV
jgi:hypothetical protein